MESQPQTPEFRNNPENFHQCSLSKSLDPDKAQQHWQVKS